MHLYQRRPRGPAGPPQAKCARGKCCLAPQSLLFFGDDRREPIQWRRVIVWAETGDLVQVLPTTTRRNDDLLLIARDGCALEHPRPEEQDSYVCPRVEVVPKSELREVGALKGPFWLTVIRWKRTREGRQ